jgi:hypothetical protein
MTATILNLHTYEGLINQTHPWVVPLGISHFDFPWPIQLWKIIGNTSINIFIIFLMNQFIKFYIFWNFNTIKKKKLMFLIITFIKSFTNIVLVPFLEFFGQEYKFETWFEIFLGKFFFKVNFEGIIFLGFY